MTPLNWPKITEPDDILYSAPSFSLSLACQSPLSPAEFMPLVYLFWKYPTLPAQTPVLLSAQPPLPTLSKKICS